MAIWQVQLVENGNGSRAKSRLHALASLTLCVLLGFLPSLQAIENEYVNSGLSDKSLIGTHAFSKVHGRLAVNQAAGEANVQSNSHALGDSAKVQISIQSASPLVSETTHDINLRFAHSQIETASFANFEGLLGVNQVSGQHNVQANLGVISGNASIELMSDAQMLEINSNLPLPETNAELLHFTTEIAKDSLQQARGIIQINQISGTNNTAVNQFSLQLSNGD
ncbi:MAG: hypothetical protein ACRDA8_15590 [Shewanella sp.]